MWQQHLACHTTPLKHARTQTEGHHVRTASYPVQLVLHRLGPFPVRLLLLVESRRLLSQPHACGVYDTSVGALVMMRP